MRHTRVVFCILATVLLASGCGQSNGPAAPGAPAGGGRRSSVTIKGSDTMVILGQRWAETYRHHKPDIAVPVTGGGSGTGIAALINGGTDICAASRPIKDKERGQVKARRGKDAVEIPVALDGVVVFLNTGNVLDELTVDQLRGIYTGKVTDWKELGAVPGKIVCYGRENSSGTYQFVKEHVLNNEDFATEVQSLPGTAAVINAVEKDARAIGYGGHGFVKGVKTVRVTAKQGEPGVAPTQENVVSGKYPLSRKLFFYTVGEPEGEVKAFIDWALCDEGQKVCEEVGYYPLPKK